MTGPNADSVRLNEFDLDALRAAPRYRKSRMCVCGPDNMGWGCCCAGVTTVKEDPEGVFVLLRADVLAWLLDRVKPTPTPIDASGPFKVDAATCLNCGDGTAPLETPAGRFCDGCCRRAFDARQGTDCICGEINAHARRCPVHNDDA